MFTVQSHPIQSLCSDILAEIFTFCLPDVPQDHWEVERISNLKAPLLLCFVCSSWRSLTISTPRLWQTLHLHSFHSMFSSDMSDSESITSGIRTWLDRSRALPLSIRLTFWPKDPESYDAIKCRLAFKVLLQEVSRWESFVLNGGNDKLWVTPPRFGILPMLHTFSIVYSLIDGIPFTAAPRLKRLGLHSLPNLTSASTIPWDQLVKLTIERAQTISVVVEVIRHCPQLESLLLKVNDGIGDGSLSFRSITQHDTLRSLHLYMKAYNNTITDHLTLPALTDLSLKVDYVGIPEVEAKFCGSQLVNFFTRSNCKLQEFQLRCFGFVPGELLECLSHQSCQTLTCLVMMVNKELLIRLTYPDVDGDVPLCPKLAHLQLMEYASDRSFPDLLGRMIQSRCFGRAQDAQLRSLQLPYYRCLSQEDRGLLEFANRNGGLELRF